MTPFDLLALLWDYDIVNTNTMIALYMAHFNLRLLENIFIDIGM